VQCNLLRHASLFLLLSDLLRLVFFLYVLDSNCDHGLEGIDSVITSVMEVPADDSQLSQNAAKISGVGLPLEISPHERRVGRLQQVRQIMNIIADSFQEVDVSTDVMANENDIALWLLVMARSSLFGL
jgi:hypothetical protein